MQFNWITIHNTHGYCYFISMYDMRDDKDDDIKNRLRGTNKM